MRTYENQENVVDRSILEADQIPFSVLYRVLGGPVKKVVTDHKRIIIAHTAPVFPTWIWTPDDVTEEELDTIYRTIRAEFSPLCEYRFNTKYEIAGDLLRRFQEDGETFRILANIAAYECPAPQKPGKEAEGHMELLRGDEADLAARLIREASAAIGDVVLDEEQSLEAAREQLARQCLYIWRDGSDRPVSFCERREESDQYTAVSQCYTVADARRKNYAGHLIYEVCREIREQGQTPILYADADYLPSNRCYQNIGFVLRGKIAMIGAGRGNPE